LGPGDYGIFKDWSAIDKLQDKYIPIRDGLVSEGEVQEMNNKEFFLRQGAIRGTRLQFFIGIPPGGCLSLLVLVLPGRT
jgi:hypothetical protein